MSDALASILAMIRAELPELDPQVAARIEIRIRGQYAGERVYIGAAPKRVNLLKLSALGPAAKATDVQRALGVGRTRAYALLTMTRG